MIVIMETPDDDVKNLAADTKTKIQLFSELEEKGKNNLKQFVASTVILLFACFYFCIIIF